MPRLPIPSDTEGFSEETCAAVRHILQTRHSMPPPSSYLTYALMPSCLLWMRPAGPTPRTRGGLTIPPGAGEAAVGAPGQDPSPVVARPTPIKMQLITDYLAAQGAEPEPKAVATPDLVTSALEGKLDSDRPRIQELDEFAAVDAVE
jgi:hypothetical protein